MINFFTFHIFVTKGHKYFLKNVHKGCKEDAARHLADILTNLDEIVNNDIINNSVC